MPISKETKKTEELKWLDTTITDVRITDAGQIVPGGTASVIGVTEGTAKNQRIGRLIKGKSLEVRLCFTNQSIAAPLDTATLVRMVVVLDKATNYGVPGITEVLNIGNNPVTGMPNTDNKGRFRILKDITFKLHETGAVGTTTDRVVKHFYIPLNGIEFQFKGVGGTTGDIVRNNVRFQFYSTSTTVADIVRLYGDCRFAYYG